MSVWYCFDDFLDLINKYIKWEKINLIIDPISPSFMQRLNNLFIFHIIRLTIIFKQLNKITIFEKTADPIPLLWIFQYTVPLKDIILKLSNINIPILKSLLSHPTKLSINIISPFNKPQLKLILISQCIRIQSSLWSSNHKHKP